VIDARGPSALERPQALGFQKFVGLELEVEPNTAPATPTLMDARVPQTDGFRFFYVLPLSAERVLLEDTYFSEQRGLRRATIRPEILAYATSLGLNVRRVVREEAGVLPIPGRALVDPGHERGLVRAGYRGGFFHPTTGYSFPLAVRVATAIAQSTPETASERLLELARTEARQQRYAALLNRMMFSAFAPERRFGALEHFYRLPAPTVRRFYALELTALDRARILCGRPPRGFSLTRLFAPRDAASVRSLPGENA
jgi:lycopene beta-cyclase